MSAVMVLGNATLDVVQRVQRLPAIGETVLGDAPMRCPGGKGLNQAVVAARAGARVTFAAAIGADEAGIALRMAMAREPIADVRWIDVPVATDLSSIWVDGTGRNMIVSSAAAARHIAPAQAAVVAAPLGEGDWLLLQGNLSAEATLAAAMSARARGARVAVNAAPVAFAFDPVLAAPRVEVADTAGAGDPLTGLRIADLALGADMEAALRLAVAGASLSVTRAGTSTAFPTEAEIVALRR